MLSPNTSPATAEAVNGNTTMPADDVQANNMPTATIAVREIFEREVLAALPDALQFPVSTVSLPVFASLLNQPEAVALVPQSIAPVLPSGAQLCQLDVQLSSPLPPLGVVHRREQIPAMLIRMLKSWRNK